MQLNFEMNNWQSHVLKAFPFEVHVSQINNTGIQGVQSLSFDIFPLSLRGSRFALTFLHFKRAYRSSWYWKLASISYKIRPPRFAALRTLGVDAI